jgi:uncharacterized protein
MVETIFGVEVFEGKKSSGYFLLENHPAGFEEKIPVIILKGKKEGPTLTISANMHGDEYTGTSVIHEIVSDSEILNNLSGTVICFPTLNPFGLTKKNRLYSFGKEDPNRSFPSKDSLGNTSFTERCMRTFFGELVKHTSFHIDLHCSKLRSIPFIYLEPNFEEISKEVLVKSKKMADDFGLFTLHDNKDSYYTSFYNRSLSGSLSQIKNIPCITVELSSKKIIDPVGFRAGVVGVKNVLKGLQMLPGNVESQHLVLGKDSLSYEMTIYPYMPKNGFVSFLVKPGQEVKVGDSLVKVKNIFGEEIEELKSKVNGVVIAQYSGLVFYKGDSLLKIAVPIKE